MNNTQRNTRTEQLKAALQQRQAVKVIAGIANTNLSHVSQVVTAATEGGATALDISADPTVVAAVRAQTDLPVFASAIDVQELVAAAKLGADVLELGNYDALYEQGLFFTEAEVMTLAKALIAEARQLNVMTSITLPGHLTVETQLRMLDALETLGADIIQTEGASRALSTNPQTATLSASEKAQITFDTTLALAAATSLPVMSASGINQNNITNAFTMGAAAVGIGRAVSRLETTEAMTDAVAQMMRTIHQFATSSAKLSHVS